MNLLLLNRRMLALVGVLLPLLALFIYVVLSSGPLAPVPVTVTTIEARSLSPALFGIGTVDARYTYRVGPTTAGRVKVVEVNVGDMVQAGQLLGEMDPVDLDDRLAALETVARRAEATVLAAEAQVQEALARKTFARSQVNRYESLLESQFVTDETVEAKQQEHRVAEAGFAVAGANMDAARQELSRVRADLKGLIQQRANLRLVAPADGLVVSRDADPGTTVIAGQAVVQVIDPKSLWINVRFDQLNSSGLRDGLSSRILLRSQAGNFMAGRVMRVEPISDAVTEEVLAKVVFDTIPDPLPPVGELAEVTVELPALPSTPVVPSASVQRVEGFLGVWLIEDSDLSFAPIKVGATDLEGWVQILDGVKTGQSVVVYSQRALSARRRVKVVDQIPGMSQ